MYRNETIKCAGQHIGIQSVFNWKIPIIQTSDCKQTTWKKRHGIWFLGVRTWGKEWKCKTKTTFWNVDYIKVHEFNIQYPIQYTKQFRLIFTFGMLFFLPLDLSLYFVSTKIVLDIHAMMFHTSIVRLILAFRFNHWLRSSIFSGCWMVLQFVVDFSSHQIVYAYLFGMHFTMLRLSTFNNDYVSYCSSSSNVLVFTLHRKKKYW